MLRLNRKYLILALLFPALLFCQEYIGGIVNEYFSVSSFVVGANSVACAGEDLSGLEPGDKVVLIQMTGGFLKQTDSDWVASNGKLGDSRYGSAGRYEFLAVSSVNNSTKEIFFSANIKRGYDANEKLQLVKMVEAEYVTVSSELKSDSWDSASGKGGVVAIVALKKLVLEDDIDVTSQGFSGADPTLMTGCSENGPATPDTFYFKSNTLNKAGVKGEGVLTDTFSYNVGIGNALNGGGGGAGYKGGGGGGSNYNPGGVGGFQSQSCDSSGQYARGGIGLGNTFYDRWLEYGEDSYERWAIAMGGGGGAGTQEIAIGSSPGGNGGGIVIILTDTLDGNSHSISSNGTYLDMDAIKSGAGGGGAGGVVIIDANVIVSAVNVNVTGGNGGSASECSGAGGGGSGGVLWHSGETLSTNITFDDTGGKAGTSFVGGVGDDCVITQSGTTGSDGTRLDDYEPLLNGFSFNSIVGDDTICQGQAPGLISGSTPRGVAPFTYEWISSIDNTTWVSLSETTKNYQPDELLESLYFTRIVINNDGIPDTAFSVYVYVYDSISDNILQLRDTLCEGSSPGSLMAQNVNGGNSVYSYSWETSTDLASWVEKSAWENITNPIEGVLNETTYYRRMVNSAGVCVSLSEVDTITVHESIQNNIFTSPDTTICVGLDAGTILCGDLSGGLEGSYTYSWLQSINGVDYTSVLRDLSDYSPGIRNTTSYYHRVVYSGNDSACIDTTTVPHIVTVLNDIFGNNIASDSTRYCSGDLPTLIIGGELSGAQEGVYDISWWQNEGAGLAEISGESSSDYQPEVLTDTVKFYRKVISGEDEACTSWSNELEVKVIPSIINELASEGQNVCENEIPDDFIELEASGGAGVYAYQWLERSEMASDWSLASIDQGVNTAYSYAPSGLSETTEFKRYVSSEICSDTSNGIEIVVYPEIEQNYIIGGVEQYVCYNSPKNLTGSTSIGGKEGEEYSYSWESSVDLLTWQDASGDASSKDYRSSELVSGEYFRRIVLSGETAQCKDTTEAVYVPINLLPSGYIVDSLDTLCSGTNVSIEYYASGNGPWIFGLGENELVYTEEKEDATGIISFELNESINVRLLSIMDDSLCYADLSSNTGVFEAVVYEMPVSYAGEDFEACGKTTKLAGIPSAGIGEWLAVNASFEDSSDAVTGLEVDNYGTSEFIWRETNWAECVDEDAVSVIFYEQPSDINAGEDVILNYEFETDLNASDAMVGAGFWSFAAGVGDFTDSTNATTTVFVDEVAEYKLVWSIENGVCPIISDSLVLLVKDLNIYGGFSPNGDGINDVFTLDIAEGSEAVFTIIDRNGNQVKKINSISLIQWDGTNERGNQVPNDTYFFILEEERRAVKTGYLELRR